MPPILMIAIRTCIHNRLTQSGQVFFRPAALKNLAIQQVFLRFFALQDEKIPVHSAHREILNRLLAVRRQALLTHQAGNDQPPQRKLRR